MDQHVADVALEALKEKRTRLAKQFEQFLASQFDEKQLKADLYSAFIQHHRKRYPQISIGRIHEHFLKERNALGRQAIVDVVKNELYSALGHPRSKYWEQIDLSIFAIDICCYAQFIPSKKKRETSPVIIMNDITKRVESQLNIQSALGAEECAGTSTSTSNADDNIERVIPGSVHYLETTEELPSEEEW
uniref:Uncharacterized protein n=1 Tax=Meloidogyne hapla TaxID=6305 RepID=A0A1I8BJP0_MELHA